MKNKQLTQYRNILTSLLVREYPEDPKHPQPYDKWEPMTERVKESQETVNRMVADGLPITPMNVLNESQLSFPIHQFKFKSKKK